ncbi:MAG: KpsF/GutQ family sugar-phosphate isomerase [Candidatus Omnitrophica bacterium]|nr:KpsF/GutQ family sugar-phosphate isomerase [Candidatus Omnitrophota bacterium]
MKNEKIIEIAKKIIDIECKNIEKIKDNLNNSFVEAIECIYNMKGKIVITGMGKSGIIGRKISATFSSIGIPSIFLHPGEAIHGDLGMVTKQDVLLVISNSGETEEIIRIIPIIKKIGAQIITITSSKNSTIGLYSDIIIETGEIEEADPFGIIPSSSTTCALILGDAISLTIMAIKGIQKEDFAFYHPGGNLGKRLMLKVKDFMQTGDKIPKVNINNSLEDAIREINDKNIGFTLVVDNNGKLVGIITDGDIRRFLLKQSDIKKGKIEECMTKNPKTIQEDRLAVQAIAMMEKLEITCLVIVDEENKPKAIVHLHDLLGKKEFGIEY